MQHFTNPLQTAALNAPDGVNLMANTAMLGVAAPLALPTLALGPEFTYALVLTSGLALSCAAWFWLFRRWLVERSSAAAVAAGFCAFAPSVISHANAHANFTFLPLIPLIVDRVLMLATGGRVVRNGVLLGLFVAYHVFLGEEILLAAALGLAVFGISYVVFDAGPAPVRLPAVVRGAAVGAAVALPLVLWPLLWQFFGPGSYSKAINVVPNNTLRSFAELPSRSLGGHGVARDPYGWTEQNTFFGWALIGLGLAIAVVLWKLTAVRAAALTILVAATFSMGASIPVPGTTRSIPGPWALFSRLPLFDSLVPSRLAMICVPGLAVLLALAVERVVDCPNQAVRNVGVGLVAASLVPLVPTPFPVSARPPVPSFITDGIWRSYIRPGHSLVVAPLPSIARAEAMHWSARAELGFDLVGGYFCGPHTSDWHTWWGAAIRPTAALLDRVQSSGRAVEVSAADRAAAQVDLNFWHADAMVIDPSSAQDALRKTIQDLLGTAAGLRRGRLRVASSVIQVRSTCTARVNGSRADRLTGLRLFGRRALVPAAANGRRRGASHSPDSHCDPGLAIGET